jgi:hypothetical protein
VLLTGSPDVEAGDVDELRSYPNVALANEDTCVVDGFGKALFVDLGLKTTLQQLLSRQLKHEIKLELVVGEESIAGHTTKKRSSLKDPLGILGVEGKKRPRYLTKLGKGILHSPDLALAPQSVLSDELELGVEAFLLVRTPGCLRSLAV